MRRPAVFPLLLAAALTAPCYFARAQDAPSGRAADRITHTQLRSYLTFIASDDLEGRQTPSRGLDVAARFLASNVERWGLKPAGDDGTYFQKIELRQQALDPTATTLSIGDQAYKPGTDFLPATAGFFPRVSPGSASGPAVYVGYGWMVKAKSIDPYAGLDVKDKILIVLSHSTRLPKGIVNADLQGKQGEDWDSPERAARRLGARGIIWVPSFQNLASWTQMNEQLGRSRTDVANFVADAAGIPSVTASPSLVARVFQGEKESGEQIFARGIASDPGASFELNPARKFTLNVAVKNEKLFTQNVVAVLEGSDPALKSEYVAFGAHYDHVGTRADGADRIYNGADDDGSGTTALLAMAEAFAQGPRPKRSLLFVWHAGEEHGLWGSRYFTENPTVPLNQVVAQLNIDMIGRSKKADDMNPRNRTLSGPNQIYVIGSKVMSDEIGSLTQSVNAGYLNVEFDYRYDDPKDPNRFFFRSDHINYARKGIPIVFFFDGVHEDYHRVSDSVDKIDFEKMTKVTRTVAALAGAIADLPKRPNVDRPLPADLGGAGS
jgi:hypothetical protein